MRCQTGESMMKTPDHKTSQRVGKVFLVFVGICILALPFVVLSALSYETKETEATILGPQSRDFDHKGGTIFETYDRMPLNYLGGMSTQRTLVEYYSLRRYNGSPPYIPHEFEDAKGTKYECLSCHAKGGFSEEMKRNTPLTPHPENVSCRQCHVKPKTDTLFVKNNWMSLPPPILGRSYLPGSPPPVPHPLQMRENCVACHVGSGAVAAIRVEHPTRGNCRQCHLPDLFPGLFQRASKEK